MLFAVLLVVVHLLVLRLRRDAVGVDADGFEEVDQELVGVLLVVAAEDPRLARYRAFEAAGFDVARVVRADVVDEQVELLGDAELARTDRAHLLELVCEARRVEHALQRGIHEAGVSDVRQSAEAFLRARFVPRLQRDPVVEA